MSSMSYQGYTDAAIAATSAALTAARQALQSTPPNYRAFLDHAQAAWTASRYEDTNQGVDDGAWDEMAGVEGALDALHFNGEATYEITFMEEAMEEDGYAGTVADYVHQLALDVVEECLGTCQ